MRKTTQHHRAALKAAFRRALDVAGGGDSFCHATRVGAPALSNYANQARDDLHSPLDVVLDLEMDIGAPIVTAELARLNGYRLVPIEPAAGGPDLGDIAAISGEGGDVVRAIAEALADGRIDDAERARLTKEGDELHAAVNAFLARLAAGKGGDAQ